MHVFYKAYIISHLSINKWANMFRLWWAVKMSILGRRAINVENHCIRQPLDEKTGEK